MKVLSLIAAILILLPAMLAAQANGPVFTLQECVDMALENNYNLNFAKIDNRIAHKNYLQSYSNILPSVNFSLSGSKYEQGPTSYIGGTYVGENPNIAPTVEVTTGRFYSADLNINQTIFDGGRWYFNIKQSQWNKRSSDFEFYSAQQNVIVTVRQLFMDLLKQSELLKVKKQAVGRSEDQLTRVRSMYEVGSVAQIDVYRSQVNLGSDQISLLNQQNTEREARQSLNIAMGRQPDAPLQIDSTVAFEKDVKDLDSLVQTALHKNPEVQAQRYDIRSAEYGVWNARSAFLPNLNAFYGYGRSVPRFQGLYEEFDREYSWRFGLNLSWNLFNGFSDYLGVQKAELNKRYVSEQLEYSKLTLESRVRTLYHNLEALNEIIEVNRTNLNSAQEDYRLAEERYRLGSGTLLDLRDAQVNLATSEQILVAAQFDAYITYAELQQALGALVPEN
ncbi:MAG: TolC family protein [Calditrichia bacterium]